MAVRDRLVSVNVAVRLPYRHAGRVRVPMVLVMPVHVLVLQRFMGVLVLVVLAHVQAHAERHERRGRHEAQRDGLAEHEHTGDRAHERRGGKVGAGPPRAEVAQGDDVEDQAQPEAQQADERRGSDDDAAGCRRALE